MAFTGYQEGAPANAMVTDSQNIMGQLTAPDFMQVMQSSFEDNGTIKLYNSKRALENQAQAMLGIDIKKDDGWDPVESIKGLGPAYEHNYSDLMNTQNQADFLSLVNDLDRQRQRNEVLSSAGANGYAAFAGGMADPVNLIPVEGAYTALGKSARLAARTSVAQRSQHLFGTIRPLDRDFAIRTMWGEARNQGDNGLAAVANVILNRAEKGNYGKNLQEIVTAKNQFEPWGSTKTRAAMQRLDPTSPEYQKLGEIFDRVALGKIPDITNGADMFFAPKAQAALGREAPSWGRGSPLAQIGDHHFFSSDGNPIDKLRRKAVDDASRVFWGSTSAGAMEVMGQYLANPDYSGKDAVTTMGMASLLGLGGGAMAFTVNELRASKLAMDQSTFTRMMRDKMGAAKGFGVDPDLKSFKGIVDAIKTAGEPLSNWKGRLADAEDELGVQPKSMGAAAVRSNDPVSVYKVGNVAKFLRYTNPILDTLSGASNDAKRIMSNLYEHNILTNSDIRGEPLAPGGAVATRVRVHMGKLADFQRDIDDLYRAYQKQQINQKNQALSRVDFEREVWRGTWGSSRTDNTFVRQGVDAFHKKIGQPFLQEAQGVGLIKTGAGETYSPVIYNRQAIRADQDGFKQKVKEATVQGYNNYVAKNPQKAAKLAFDPNVDKKELEKFASDYTRFWATDTDETMADMADAKSGRVKNRVSMPLQYNLMEDFMENQIGDLASRYVRSMAPDIELQRSFGSLDLANERQAVKNEYDSLIKEAKTEKEKAALTKERDRMVDNIDWSVKNIRNRDDYSMMTSEGLRTAIKALNLWTFTRGMGKFVVNAVAESGMPLLVHGYKNTYGEVLKDYHNGFKGLKMAREQALLAGIAVDRALADRMTALLDGVNTANDQNMLERNIDRMMGGAAKLFGMPMVNDTFRSMSTMWNNHAFGNDIPVIASLGKVGLLDNAQKIKYANLGIGQDEARIIAQEMEKHSEWVDDKYFAPNTQKWEPDAARLYNSALMKAVDNEFLIPQAGDLPKVAQTAWGKPLFFLRSYTFTATNRLALAGLQRANPQMAKGMAQLLAMGMLSNALYQAASGREQPQGLEMVYGALDRAGVLGLFWEANNLADKTLGVGLGNGDEQKSFSNPIEQVGGPNAYTVGDTLDFMSQPSMDKAYALMPGQNWLPMEAAKRVLTQ